MDTTTTETFEQWVRTQMVRAAWMDEFLQGQLGGDESRMVRVTRRSMGFGVVWTVGLEAA